MLKINTVLTALAVILLALLSFIGAHIWNDVSDIKGSQITTSEQIKDIYRRVEDHEGRIRVNEHDVIILQQHMRTQPPHSLP